MLLVWEHTLRTTEVDIETDLSPEIPLSNQHFQVE